MTQKILIVDHYVYLRLLVRLVLEHEGYEIHEAADGPSGLAAARRLLPDLMLLDVTMSGDVDGFSVCRQVHEDPALRATRVVFLTDGDCHESSAKSMNACLRKPFSPTQLIDVVKGQWGTAGRVCLAC